MEISCKNIRLNYYIIKEVQNLITQQSKIQFVILKKKKKKL